ncbi:DUF952 domain-containing protein [Tumebacillus permanentifrigoris]|uniref:Uncharacterized protein (DUF952 family) n=1 Tax=Tumebacillus permanentifrigoris TaxID=378543 RepID=A0A316DAS1_9BACL|nr:DUF952 domain-containing protein [Tumebacillus permanentifrigoris]PWK13507.1 uncharacterized protein (DUF952 family) [Tumebacillus permanentifrigoris]
MSVIYCLVPAPYWAQFAGKSEYVPRDYEQEGFIHATCGDDLLVRVMNRVYSKYEGDLLLLVIDEERVTAEVKYEQASDGQLYPHIYGALNTDAIVDVRQMERGTDGWKL